MTNSFRCTNGDFYVVLSSSMGLALLVWVGSGLLERVLYLVGNQPSLCRKSPINPAPVSNIYCVVAVCSHITFKYNANFNITTK